MAQNKEDKQPLLYIAQPSFTEAKLNMQETYVVRKQQKVQDKRVVEVQEKELTQNHIEEPIQEEAVKTPVSGKGRQQPEVEITGTKEQEPHEHTEEAVTVVNEQERHEHTEEDATAVNEQEPHGYTEEAVAVVNEQESHEHPEEKTTVVNKQEPHEHIEEAVTIVEDQGEQVLSAAAATATDAEELEMHGRESQEEQGSVLSSGWQVKPFKEMTNEEKLHFLANRPHYIPKTMCEVRTVHNSFTGYVLAFKNGAATIKIFTTNRTKNLQVKLEDILSIRMIGF